MAGGSDDLSAFLRQQSEKTCRQKRF